MKVTVEDRARDFVQKKGQQAIHVYVRGCSS